MAWFGMAAAAALIAVMLVDTFEALVLPRRVRHADRLARLFYQSTWAVWRNLALLFPARRWQLAFLSIFGPLSLFALIALWATGLVVGFALLHWSLHTSLSLPLETDEGFVAYV